MSKTELTMLVDQILITKARKMRKLLSLRRPRKIKRITSAKLFQQGNFTAVMLNSKHLGIAKRNPEDHDNGIGLELAIHRALENMVEVSPL